MQHPAYGSYSIVQENNILLVDAQGPFNEKITKKYRQDIEHYIKKMADTPWGSIVSFKGNGIFTPDAEQNLIETTDYRIQNGMVAVAAVICDSANADILQMQLQRIYQSSQIRFHFFSDLNSAKIWLNSFINEQISRSK